MTRFTLPIESELKSLGFTPPAEVWSTNRHGSWQKNMRLHKEWENYVGWLWLALPSTMRRAHMGAPATVRVSLTFPMNRKRDPHNYVGTVVKAIVDGLVRVGVWPDDTPEWVSVAEPVLKVGPPWVEVRLEPRGGTDV